MRKKEGRVDLQNDLSNGREDLEFDFGLQVTMCNRIDRPGTGGSDLRIISVDGTWGHGSTSG